MCTTPRALRDRLERLGTRRALLPSGVGSCQRLDFSGFGARLDRAGAPLLACDVAQVSMMTGRELSVGELEKIREVVADALLVLGNVADGDCSAQLDVDAAGRGPLGFLLAGINDLIATVGTEQEQSSLFHRELDERLATVEQQRSAIRSLSTPVIEIWRGVLCLPVVGVIDTARSVEMTGTLLQTIVEKGSKYAIIDITGIEVMDTRTVDHFIRMAKAIRLLGAECALTGLNPYIAQTIVHMGVDLRDIVTHRSLRDALYRFVTQNRQ
jgi:rsbT co-antagonist protein RsbR